MRSTGHISEEILAGLIVAAALIAVPPARAAVAPSAIDFGNQTVGTTAAPQTVTITDTGKGPLVVASASWSLPQFSYTGPSLPLTLKPGESMTASVFFTPTATQIYNGTLSFKCMRGPTLSVSLSGTGVLPASSSSLQVAPSIISEPVNQTVIAGQTATFSVVASGTSLLTYQWMMNGAAISGASSSIYTTSVTTTSDSGEQFTVAVSNSAGIATSNAATLTVSAASGQLTITPASQSFGSVNIGSSSTLGVTLSNSSTADVTVSNISLAGSGFNASGVPTGLILAPGNTANMNVTFSPASTGSVTGGVTISSDATNSPAIVSLSGTGTSVSHSVALSWSPSTSSVIGYNVYSSTVSGGSYTKLTATPVATAGYTDTSVQSGDTYYYVVTSVDSNDVESVFSNEVSATIP
jgi:Abnormal spindle-like microcephaly-assoc'd, ASPM-SPD-2-Hydin/Cep192 domain 4